MKTWFKISFLTILLGWFFFMWLCMYGFTKSAEVRLAIGLSGIFLCMIGSFAFQALLVNKAFWMKQDELEDYIEKHKKSIEQYNQAKEALMQHLLSIKAKAKEASHEND